jgi:hypothetical protein
MHSALALDGGESSILYHQSFTFMETTLVPMRQNAREPHSLYECCGEEEYRLHLPGMEF